MYFREGLEPDTHIPKIDDAKALTAQIKGQTGTVISAETARRRDLPPQLYDLTSLQRDANRLLGFTADKTLKLAQSLYETRKALTYPRTDSRYLPPDMIPRVVQTMKVLPESYQALVPGALPDGKLPVSKRTIDETKVTDHHAILPTPKRINLDSLPEDARRRADADGKAAAPAAGKAGCARLNGRNHPAGRRDFVLPQRVGSRQRLSPADVREKAPLIRLAFFR